MLTMSTFVPRAERGERARRTFSILTLIAATLPLLATASATATAQDLAVLRDVEVELLAKRFGDYQESTAREHDATAALRETLDRLNAMIGDEEVEVASLRRLEAEVSLAREAAYLRARETTDLRMEIYSRMERIEALDQVLGIGAGRLSGNWTLNLGPDDGAGTATFRTYGDRVEGSYQMADGHRGSFLGTLLDGRLELERIDTVEGRDRKLIARLSENGRRLSGTWQLFELASGRRTEGSWEGRKLDRE
jgi:hypothetical protein